MAESGVPGVPANIAEYSPAFLLSISNVFASCCRHLVFWLRSVSDGWRCRDTLYPDNEFFANCVLLGTVPNHSLKG